VHDFRRSAVKNLIRARVPEKVAMEITGYRTRAIFDHIVDESDMRAALEQTQAYLDSDMTETNVRELGQ
jgi:pheromone shutdown protein TraB